MRSPSLSNFHCLAAELEGVLHFDATMRRLYATDASVYREMPQAVALPKSEGDICKLIRFARQHGTSLIPRTAGTSLAGQVVGAGIVVDVSRHFTGILEIDPVRRRVRVQPGVVRNELNLALAPHGLFFAPETSTQNRCMIGGMVGNNACGANSLVYGSTREHLVAVRAVMSDGSIADFGSVSPAEFAAKGSGDTLEAAVYREINKLLGEADNRAEISREFPKPSIHRRNTGYALDLLAACAPFTPDGPPFNFCRLLAGSEGTLAFLTEITLACEPLPPRETALLCVHCATIDEALRANLVALRHGPRACELMDDNILECTKANLEQRQNRFFVQGDPGAILAIELAAETRRWHQIHANKNGPFPNGRVFLFCDEFTNFNDEEVGIKAVRLLNRLGYEVIIPKHVDSGRAQISKGLLRDAQRLAIRNVELLKDVVSLETPIVGIEPSAILGFRDEVPDLVPARLVEAANAVAKQALLIDKFIAREADRGHIRPEAFTKESRQIKLHGHCYQKSLASLTSTVKALELPVNYKVQVVPSGCCGMAGSFGYEKEHFDISMEIAGLVLLPAMRSAPVDAIIAAPGTSCRHQIKDGIGRIARHPAEILHDALA
jgi:FAD/FMN-containing dehydrogenase